MTVLYQLAAGQLSKQSHYDFGLRALKAVLVMAGELKRGSQDLHEVQPFFFCGNSVGDCKLCIFKGVRFFSIFIIRQ